jgi:hypothetical protein
MKSAGRSFKIPPASEKVNILMIFRQPDAHEDNKVNTRCIHWMHGLETPSLWAPSRDIFGTIFLRFALTFVAWFPKKVMAYSLLRVKN